MTKDEILDAIRRCASEDGLAPGKGRFESETGIRESVWIGKYWARWSDALREAGFEPNRLQSAYPESDVLSSLALLARELGQFPTHAEMRIKRRSDPSFPSHNVFARFGNRAAVATRLLAYCSDHAV
jgi:hypothetical protein